MTPYEYTRGPDITLDSISIKDAFKQTKVWERVWPRHPRYNGPPYDGSQHMAWHYYSYDGTLTIGRRVWEIHIEDLSKQVWNVEKDPRWFFVDAKMVDDEEKTFSFMFGTREVRDLYVDRITGDIWLRDLKTFTRIFCEEEAVVRI